MKTEISVWPDVEQEGHWNKSGGKVEGKIRMEQNTVVRNYACQDNLNTRVNLHQKYHTSEELWEEWLLKQYEIANGSRVLEIGCGTGYQWDNQLYRFGGETKFIFSDISLAMVDGVKDKFHSYPNVEVMQMDANDIPFEQDSLDVVIANHMLYHIDNVDGVLKSISNVLKEGGKIYAATNGESSMSELWAILRNLGIERKYCKHSTFSLENGGELLRKYFRKVEMREFVDSDYVDNLEDLYYYMESLPSVQDSDVPFEKRRVMEYLESVSDENGGILLPKKVGLFVGTK